MPRGKTESGSETRSRILREASRLFALEGFRATSLREIARAAGIEHPSVLHHFPDGKIGIYRTIIHAIINESSGVVARSLQLSNQHAALSIADGLWDFFANHQEYAALILRSGFDVETEEGKQFQSIGSEITALVKTVVESSTGRVGFADGELEEIVFVMGMWCLTYHGSPQLTKNIWLFGRSRGRPKQIFLDFLQQKFQLRNSQDKGFNGD